MISDKDQLGREFQQQMWDRSLDLAQFAIGTWVDRLRSVRHQIVSTTQANFPDINNNEGVVDARVRHNPRLQLLRGELVTLMERNDPETRRIMREYCDKMRDGGACPTLPDPEKDRHKRAS